MRYSTKKVAISVIFMLCFLLAACGNVEQGRASFDEGTYFLLLNDNETISINTYENNRINELQTFVISESSLFATDKEERVAVLHADKNIAIIYDFQTSQKVELSIPYKIKPISMLLNGDNLFIGGKMHPIMGEEMLIQYHIQSGEWYLLEIPEHLRGWGKAVDDLVVSDSFLIAIDNIIIPKYLLYYHLNSTGKLELSHYKQIPFNGSSETIRQGRITSDYLGLLSRTQRGWVEAFEHITIFNCLDLTKSFAISIEIEWQGMHNIHRFVDAYTLYTINDFLLVGDKVLIAHRTKGLGVFEIDDSYFETNTITLEDGVTRIWLNARVDAGKINYFPFENEEIIRLIKIPNEPKIVLTLRNAQGRIRHEIFALTLGG